MLAITGDISHTSSPGNTHFIDSLTFMKDNPAGTRRCKDVGIRLIFGRDQSDVVKTLESG